MTTDQVPLQAEPRASPQGFDPAYFDSLVDAEDNHFWFAVRNRVIASVLRRLVRNKQPGYHVLEIGCGAGNVLRVLESTCVGGQVMGVELFEEGARRARTRVDCPVVTGDIDAMSFEHRFDLIGMFDVLEHIEDDVATLRHVTELLAPGGRVLVTVPADPRLWSSFDVASHHHRRYTKESLVRSFRAAGFELEYLTPFMVLLHPLMRLRRSTPEAGGVDGSAVVDAEFRINRYVNVIAHALMLPESWWVRRGWRLPVGTSLLAVARRTGTLRHS
jgi:SAM-dependent methyltransferase